MEAKAARLLNGSGSLALVLQVRGSVDIAGKEMRHCVQLLLQALLFTGPLLNDQNCSLWPQLVCCLSPRYSGCALNFRHFFAVQLLPDKHSKQHCVCVANTQLCGSEADVQALEAGLLLKELQVQFTFGSAQYLFQGLLTSCMV